MGVSGACMRLRVTLLMLMLLLLLLLFIVGVIGVYSGFIVVYWGL